MRTLSHATQQQQYVIRYVAVVVVLDVAEAEATVLAMAMKVRLCIRLLSVFYSFSLTSLVRALSHATHQQQQ